jgi:DNA-binding IclR family transcriptional regulator
MPKPEPETSGLLLTLNRGIRVLEEIARSDGLATAKVLGTSLGINLGTVYQLIRTLQSNGYVNRLPGGRYQLGPRIGFLLDHYDFQTAPPQAVMDSLHELHIATEETVYASLVQGSEISIVASREGMRRLRVGNAVVGFSAYPHARASGKAFLAYCEPEDIDYYFDDRQLERLTENTITDWDALLSELDKVREAGVAYDLEEFDEGIACLGAVILGPGGDPVGSYSAALPTARFDRRRESVAAATIKAAERASQALGYVGSYPERG